MSRAVIVLTCFVMCRYVHVCIFCNVCVCARVFFDNCVRVLVLCALVFMVFCIVCTVFFYCFVYVYFILICFVFTSVRTTTTGRNINCYK